MDKSFGIVLKLVVLLVLKRLFRRVAIISRLAVAIVVVVAAVVVAAVAVVVVAVETVVTAVITVARMGAEG